MATSKPSFMMIPSIGLALEPNSSRMRALPRIDRKKRLDGVISQLVAIMREHELDTKDDEDYVSRTFSRFGRYILATGPIERFLEKMLQELSTGFRSFHEVAQALPEPTVDELLPLRSWRSPAFDGKVHFSRDADNEVRFHCSTKGPTPQYSWTLVALDAWYTSRLRYWHDAIMAIMKSASSANLSWPAMSSIEAPPKRVAEG